MNIRDIINALRESPYWEALSATERIALVLHNANMLNSRKMSNILQCLTSFCEHRHINKIP